MPETKESYAQFGKSLIELLDERGWNSIPKKELVLNLIHHAGNAGLLDYNVASMQLAGRLRVSPSTLQNLLRDRMLIISPEEIDYNDEEIFDLLEEKNQTGYDEAKKGQLVFAIAEPVKRLQLEAFFEEMGLLPDYKNNCKLLVVDMALLLNSMAKVTGQDSFILAEQVAENLKLSEEYQGQIKEASSEKNVAKLLTSAMMEQADKHIGENTVQLLKYFYNLAKGKV